MGDATFTVLGVDLATNHSALVLLQWLERNPEHHLLALYYLSENATAIPSAWRKGIRLGDVDHGPIGRGFLLPKRQKGESVDQWFLRKMDAQRDLIAYALEEIVGPVGEHGLVGKVDLVCIEEMARSASSNRASDLAGTSHLVRYIIWKKGLPIRFYQTSAIRWWMGLSGTEKKARLHAEIERVWTDAVMPFTKHGTRRYTHTYGDLIDAYSMARLGVTELRLRYADLEVNKLGMLQRRVWQHTTKGNPENLLTRDYLEMEEPR